MSGGRASRQKGDRFEREIVHLLQDAGFAAERMPLSGALRGKYGGYDVMVPGLKRDLKIEAKHHGDGFKRVYEWIEPADLLVMRADRTEPLVVMRMSLLIELLKEHKQTTEIKPCP